MPRPAQRSRHSTAAFRGAEAPITRAAADAPPPTLAHAPLREGSSTPGLDIGDREDFTAPGPAGKRPRRSTRPVGEFLRVSPAFPEHARLEKTAFDLRFTGPPERWMVDLAGKALTFEQTRTLVEGAARQAEVHGTYGREGWRWESLIGLALGQSEAPHRQLKPMLESLDVPLPAPVDSLLEGVPPPPARAGAFTPELGSLVASIAQSLHPGEYFRASARVKALSAHQLRQMLLLLPPGVRRGEAIASWPRWTGGDVAGILSTLPNDEDRKAVAAHYTRTPTDEERASLLEPPFAGLVTRFENRRGPRNDMELADECGGHGFSAIQIRELAGFAYRPDYVVRRLHGQWTGEGDPEVFLACASDEGDREWVRARLRGPLGRKA